MRAFFFLSCLFLISIITISNAPAAEAFPFRLPTPPPPPPQSESPAPSGDIIELEITDTPKQKPPEIKIEIKPREYKIRAKKEPPVQPVPKGDCRDYYFDEGCDKEFDPRDKRPFSTSTPEDLTEDEITGPLGEDSPDAEEDDAGLPAPANY